MHERLIGLAAAALLAACAPNTRQEVPAATQATLAPGNALVIVKRQFSAVPGAGDTGAVVLWDGDKEIGETGKAPLAWQRPAGALALQLRPKEGCTGACIRTHALTVEVAAGRSYTFEVMPQGGLSYALQRLSGEPVRPSVLAPWDGAKPAREKTTLVAHVAALPEACTPQVFEMIDAVPAGRPLGKVETGIPFIGDCSYEPVREAIRRAACAAGADAVKITAESWPNAAKACYRAHADLYRIAPEPASTAEPRAKARAPAAGDDVERKLEILKEAYDKGLITKPEYDAKRKALLDKM